MLKVEAPLSDKSARGSKPALVIAFLFTAAPYLVWAVVFVLSAAGLLGSGRDEWGGAILFALVWIGLSAGSILVGLIASVIALARAGRAQKKWPIVALVFNVLTLVLVKLIFLG